MRVIALIPARSGSKSILNKNTRLYKDIPLLCHSIKQAQQSKYITSIYVSTDSLYIRNIAIKYGALCPFLRPREISNDLSLDYDFFLHFINVINDLKPDDIIVHLRPTYPNRDDKTIDECISTFVNCDKNVYTSLRTVIPLDVSAFKMYTIDNNVLQPLFNTYKNLTQPYNCPRQILPQCYLHNGYIDITTPNTILQYKSVTGPVIYPFVMDKSMTNDIDTIEDWNKSIADK